MWVELYKTHLEKIDPTLPDIDSNNKLVVTTTGKVIQTQFITFINIEPVTIDGKKYHDVELTGDLGTRVLITARDYERVTTHY